MDTKSKIICQIALLLFSKYFLRWLPPHAFDAGPQLVIECCKNGIVGTFPALNQRSTEGFEEWVIEIKTELEKFEQETGKKAAPFGVNLIVHPTNPRVQPDLEVCMKHGKVPLIITSWGAARLNWSQRFIAMEDLFFMM